ncbi:hypothetical protein E4T56_gene3452 [Termitomyces sp. T112]|nr:hypothetical protein E4T56_gene3452 [Termitomyces sp. T112]
MQDGLFSLMDFYYNVIALFDLLSIWTKSTLVYWDEIFYSEDGTVQSNRKQLPPQPKPGSDIAHLQQAREKRWDEWWQQRKEEHREARKEEQSACKEQLEEWSSHEKKKRQPNERSAVTDLDAQSGHATKSCRVVDDSSSDDEDFNELQEEDEAGST